MQSPAIKQALGILKQLRQIMETPESVPDKLSSILQTIAAKMQADAAACYVGVDDNYLELFASYGFKQASSHRLRLRYNEGMAGEVAESKRSLVINNIWMYPKFVSKPELLEEKDFNSFIGVPVLQWNRTVGVLALYNGSSTGGTAYTVKYAYQRNKEIVIIDPTAMERKVIPPRLRCE